MLIETDRPLVLDQLARELRAALSLPHTPALSGRPPGQHDDDGTPLPGVVVLPDELDERAVRAVIDAHTPAEPVDPDAAFDAAVAGAKTLEELKAALVGRGRGRPTRP